MKNFNVIVKLNGKVFWQKNIEADTELQAIFIAGKFFDKTDSVSGEAWKVYANEV